jgi:putative FmdB family regulatory protein
MPIFEFRCRQCGRKTTALVMSRERVGEVRCRSCGGADLEKLYSRFATPKSEEARLEALADSSTLGDFDENDPASMARMMKRMGREMGEDFGEGIDEAMEEELAGGGADRDGAEAQAGDDES